MFGNRKTQVLIVGAGPVGLAAALFAAERGLKVEIIDEAGRTGAHSYALALHPHSLKLFDQLGLAADVIRQGYRIDTIALYDHAAKRAEIRLADLHTEFPFIVSLRQDTLEDLLVRRLQDQHIKVQWNHRLAGLESRDDGVVGAIGVLSKHPGGYAFASGEWLVDKTVHTDAAFVIGADGHRSVVRRILGIDYPPIGDEACFAVFEFQSEPHTGRGMCIVFDGDTTNVLWPLPGGRYRWSFQLPPSELPEASREKSRLAVQIDEDAYPHLDESLLHRLIHANAPWFTAPVREIQWSMAVRFERRLASSFGGGRIWLAGDSGHVTGPVGAQSMNVGFREADDLARRFALAAKGLEPLGSLEQYSLERLAEWRTLLGLEDGLAPTGTGDAWLAQYGSRLLSCIPASGTDLANLARQLGLEFHAPLAV